MPIYEYECTKCGRVEEAFQRISEKPLSTCRHCSGELHKLISQSSFHLKGSGWYVTDYAGKSQQGSDRSENTKDSSGSGSGESKKAADNTSE
ncbi:MAG: FmdB family transcriptional regulator [Desulfobacteraceae bacterium IS3]|nr:MAG: FmdB family transcriptional regulator [Desulfobacteraceae bacterium IS3]